MSMGQDAEPEGNAALVAVNIPEIVENRRIELIAERKRNAEHKRQADLKRIRDMKSDTGINPLEWFPKEIWEMILLDEKLDPTDRWSTWHVHQLFRDLMESTKIQNILLPQILKLTEFKHPKVLEWWRDIHDLCELGSLREVSRSIRDAVDRGIEDNLLETMNARRGSNLRVSLSCDCARDLELLMRMLSSFREMLAKGMKPFFYPRALEQNLTSRKFEYVNDLQLIHQSKNDITSLLEIIGRDLWNCSFSFGSRHRNRLESTTSSLSESYILFRQWILLMPNLKWMNIECEPLTDVSIPALLTTDYPYPPLTSLERVDIEFCEDSPAEFFIILRLALEAAEGVKDLKLNRVEDRHLERMPADLIKSFPLTSLSILRETREMEESDHYIGDVDEVELHLDMIEQIINFEWQLQTLRLQLAECLTSLEDLLNFVGGFPTLENVEFWPLLGCTVGHRDNDNDIDHWNLPNLTNLTLTICFPEINFRNNIVHLFFSLQFLVLHCRKLTMLKWSLRNINEADQLRSHLKNHERLAGGNLLDFRAGMRKLYDSIIWDVFPNLKFVKIKVSKDFEGFCDHEYRRKNRDRFIRGLGVVRSSVVGCPWYCAALNS